jgi:hypothetical protein
LRDHGNSIRRFSIPGRWRPNQNEIALRELEILFAEALRHGDGNQAGHHARHPSRDFTQKLRDYGLG